MARPRKKKRTHVGAITGSGPGQNSKSMSKDPKTMVIRIGASDVGPSVSQLVQDVRTMMAPGTASRLKERRSNRLRDYVTMAGPLGVTHLLLFSRSNSGNTNLRIALHPRGPTLNFRVEDYALCKDIKKSLKNPLGGGKEFSDPPLLVMNNFLTPEAEAAGPDAKVPKHLEKLTTSLFQSLFPPISPQTTPISSIRRVLLLNRELRPSTSSSATSETDSSSQQDQYILSLRHYAITTRRTGLPRALRRLSTATKLGAANKNKTSVPNLGKLADVSDYLLNPTTGYSSASESEIETDAEVEVLSTAAQKAADQKVKRKRADARPVEKRAVKLVELGPRMRLRLMKIEEGLCDGKVLWHEYVKKTKEEADELDEAWDKKRKEKERRKKEQKENVARKKEKAGKVRGKKQTDDDKAGDDDAMEVDEVGSDDEFEDYSGEEDEGGEGEEDDEDMEVPIG